MRLRLSSPILLFVVLTAALPLGAQQKGQYMPGQFGLNAGVLPSPGFTNQNMEINYDTSTLNDSKGNALPVKPSLNLWVIENWVIYVTNAKFLGGKLAFAIIVPTIANRSLTLEQVNFSGTTWGLADTWVQPQPHLKRADIEVGDAFVTPTGRYSPGALNNIGSGYFGNHVIMASTVYLTKNKGTSANIFTDWEVHGQKQGTNGTYKTPGQAFTDEWGVGQILPLSKNLSKLLQIGAIGYDQWQITDNGGTFALTGPLGNTIILPANALPYYSLHAVGGQVNFIMPENNFALFFKYEHEYSSYSHTLGNTIVFGGAWTLRIPKPTAQTTDGNLLMNGEMPERKPLGPPETATEPTAVTRPAIAHRMEDVNDLEGNQEDSNRNA